MTTSKPVANIKEVCKSPPHIQTHPLKPTTKVVWAEIKLFMYDLIRVHQPIGLSLNKIFFLYLRQHTRYITAISIRMVIENEFLFL